ncbi:hypothetical protein B0H10DRAFT_2121795, partial [Mycena sp. CBHHK59/15]
HRTPTTHNLPHEHRARLMRSTRKISEVVGETPLLVDLSSSFSTAAATTAGRKLKRPRCSVEGESHPSPSSVSTPDAHLHPSNGHVSSTTATTRPVLYLQLPTNTHRAPVTPLPSPTLTVTLNLAPVDEEAVRRRKMAKVRRTLGDNVPHELVFPLSTRKRDRRSRQPSILSSKQSSILESVPERARVMSAVSGRCSRARGLKANAGGSKVGRPPSVASSRTARHSKPEPLSHGWVWVGRPTYVPTVRSSRASVQSLSDDWIDVGNFKLAEAADSRIPRPRASLIRATHRREEGWSGEWAGKVGNMEDVVRELRRLKTK